MKQVGCPAINYSIIIHYFIFRIMELKKIILATMGVAMSVCVANAQQANAQQWKTSSYGLYSYPLTGNASNVAIGITPNSTTKDYKLYVNGPSYFSGQLTVNSLSQFNANVSISGMLALAGGAYIASGVTMIGSCSVGGGFYANEMSVGGAANIGGDFTSQGTAYINGNLYAYGTNNNIENGLSIYGTTQQNRTSIWIHKNEASGLNGMRIGSCGYNNYTDLTIDASAIYLNGAYGAKFMEMHSTNTKVFTDLEVTGKIKCHDELEVAEVLKANQIKAQDINVDMNNAADYVFDENYNLRSLSDVESFVKENKHLPGVPSAAEMAEKGMSMSQMSNLLLEKVEELTLHMIELEKENKALKNRVEMLEK